MYKMIILSRSFFLLAKLMLYVCMDDSARVLLHFMCVCFIFHKYLFKYVDSVFFFYIQRTSELPRAIGDTLAVRVRCYRTKVIK